MLADLTEAQHKMNSSNDLLEMNIYLYFHPVHARATLNCKCKDPSLRCCLLFCQNPLKWLIYYLIIVYSLKSNELCQSMNNGVKEFWSFDSVFHFLTGRSQWEKFFCLKPDISTTASPIATKLHGLIVPEGSTDCRCLEGRISNRDKTISGLRKDFDLDFLENGLPNGD
jgi:hypothetical protein